MKVMWMVRVYWSGGRFEVEYEKKKFKVCNFGMEFNRNSKEEV